MGRIINGSIVSHNPLEISNLNSTPGMPTVNQFAANNNNPFLNKTNPIDETTLDENRDEGEVTLQPQ